VCYDFEVLNESLGLKTTHLVLIKIIENFWHLVLVIGLALLGCLIVRLRNKEFFGLGELKEDFLKVFAP